MKVGSAEVDELQTYEREIIDLVVRFGRLIGLPKSVCEIYGLLFASIEPMSMETISQKLRMSLGSASQGLKALRNLGAVSVVYQPGQRKDLFKAEFNFRSIVTKFLNEEIHPQLAGTEACLERIEGASDTLDPEVQSIINDRIKVVRKLNRRAGQIIPAISKILSL
jgi:DNA-binding transcriptional regulator GbsR (MarR family)